MKSFFWMLLKFLFAFALFYWLYDSGRIDFSLLKISLDYPIRWAVSLSFMALGIVVAIYRWKILIDLKLKSPTHFFTILKVGWIGLFFNSIIPGSVSGDLIKLLYVKDIHQELSRSYLFASVFMDRLLGLLGLFLLMGVAALFNFNLLWSGSSEISSIMALNFLVFAILIGFLCILFFSENFKNKLVTLVRKIPLAGELAGKLLGYFFLIGRNRQKVFVCILLSALSQLIIILCFWNLVIPFIEQSFSFIKSLLFIPLGLISIAIPITPMGFGLGHAVFDKLFLFFNIENGASLFNFYFLSCALLNSLGILPFIFSNKKKGQKSLNGQIESGFDF